jgi:hypothetical protein
MNRTLNSEYKLIYRYKIKFFVFEIIEIEYEFDYSIFSEISPWAISKISEISPWAYFQVFTVHQFFLFDYYKFGPGQNIRVYGTFKIIKMQLLNTQKSLHNTFHFSTHFLIKICFQHISKKIFDLCV